MDYGINSASAINQKNYAAQGQAASNMYAGESAASTAPVSASETIISRLNSIRMNLAENRSSACHAADKIVGMAPTPIAESNASNQIKGEHPPAHCFIDALQQVIGDIEKIMRDTQDHLGRLHRSF
jgi:hypothetical protein